MSPASVETSSRFSPRFRQLAQNFIVGLALLFALFQFGFVIPNQLLRTGAEVGTGNDMDIYYQAALRLKEGKAVYQPWPEYTAGIIPNRFFYSPPFLLLTRPLVELGYVNFTRVWVLLIVGAYWIYAACLGKLAAGNWNLKATLVFGMLISLVFRGDEALLVGQFEPFMWMMMGLALAVSTKYRTGWLALATLMKIHPLWTLAAALHQEKGRGWRNLLLSALPVLLALTVVGGMGELGSLVASDFTRGFPGDLFSV